MPEYGREDVREMIEGNYRIIYRVRENFVDIVAIVDGHQPVPDVVN